MSTATSKRVILAALIANGLIAIAKFTASVFSGSAAMFAEAFHSLADTGNQLLMLLGLRLSKRPADEKHPFGYGKERYFWAFIVAVSMFTIGAVVSIYEGVNRLLHPHELGPLVISYVVLSLSILFESYAWRIAFVELRKHLGDLSMWEGIKRSKTPALMVVFLEDTAAIIGLIVALLGVFIADVTGNTAIDGIASIFIGVLLAIVAFIISYEIKSLLIGEGLEKEDADAMMKKIECIPEVESCYELLTMFLSPENILVNCQVHLVDGLDTDGVERVIDEIEEVIDLCVKEDVMIFVEVEHEKEMNS